jgi:ABC-2 type transport system ATP-binding protein
MANEQLVAAVEARSITKNYGNVQALKDFSLTIASGEVVALLGPNGAGKSTAIALMLGIRRAERGCISLFGADPRLARSRKHIGVMLQESGVPELLKVRELIELFSRFHDYPIDTQDVIERAGLENEASRRMGRLSGGQKQRLYFALALVGNPDMLFLDEPTTGLDVQARRHFWSQINQQVAMGKTIVLTTHNLEEADALAQRVVVLKEGSIVADDTPAAIKQHVGGKQVRFRAPRIAVADLQRLPEVGDVRLVGDRFELYTRQPESLLAALFADGLQLQDLEVTGAGLEEAFISLTSVAG